MAAFPTLSSFYSFSSLSFSLFFGFGQPPPPKAQVIFSQAPAMGSKADDVSRGGATTAVFLDDPPTDMKRVGAYDVKETRAVEAAGKFLVRSAHPPPSFCVSSEDRYLDDQGGLRGGEVASSLLPACSQAVPMLGVLLERRGLFLLLCIC